MKLANGATVFRADLFLSGDGPDLRGHVVARTADGEFATWWVTQHGGEEFHAYQGNYFASLSDALSDYEAR